MMKMDCLLCGLASPCALQGEFPTALAFIPGLDQLNITGNHLR